MVGHYVADFQYEEYGKKTGGSVVVDVKGWPTDLFKWKWKHTLLQYPQYDWRLVTKAERPELFRK